jgi:hypothetical protein
MRYHLMQNLCGDVSSAEGYDQDRIIRSLSGLPSALYLPYPAPLKVVTRFRISTRRNLGDSLNNLCPNTADILISGAVQPQISSFPKLPLAEFVAKINCTRCL